MYSIKAEQSHVTLVDIYGSFSFVPWDMEAPERDAEIDLIGPRSDRSRTAVRQRSDRGQTAV